LVTAFRRKLNKTIKRDEGKARLKPQEPGEWFLSQSDPSAKAGPCEIDNWDVSKRLSTTIKRGLYHYKKVPDGRRQYALWIC
jgi:hypothetical protein